MTHVPAHRRARAYPPIAAACIVLLASVFDRPAYANFVAGVQAGYMYIDLGDSANTYQVGPVVDYRNGRFSVGARALFSTYSFDFSTQADAPDPETGIIRPVDLFVNETDKNFRVDLDLAARYAVTDWLLLQGGFRYEIQDLDGSFSVSGDPELVALVRETPAGQALLQQAEDKLGRGFQLYGLALAATLVAPVEYLGGAAAFLTATLYPFAYVDSDITLITPQSDRDPNQPPPLTSGELATFDTDDASGFGGFAFEAGISKRIESVSGLSAGLSVRYQQMTIFSDSNLVVLDDEILISVLPYLYYNF